MKTSRALPLSAAVLLAAALAVPVHAAKYKIVWIGNDVQKGTAGFQDAIAQGSHGDIQVDIKQDRWPEPNDAEADPALAKMVQAGEAQMGQSYLEVVGALDPKLWAFEAPFLFRDYDHVEKVIEGPVGAELLAGLDSAGLVGLTLSYNGGASGIAGKRPITKPEDLKGMRIGVYSADNVNARWLRLLGAVPVAVGHTAALDGSLDGTVLTWKNFQLAKDNAVFSHYSLPGASYLVTATYINKAFFQSLPKEYQALLRDTARKSARAERQYTVGRNDSSRKQRLAAGVHEIPLSAETKNAFTAALRPFYKDTLEPLTGKDILEKIRDEGASKTASAGR